MQCGRVIAFMTLVFQCPALTLGSAMCPALANGIAAYHMQDTA